jgi:hypothetical protein
MMERGIKVAIWLLGVFVVLWFGYSWVADYGDGVASGTYVAAVDGETSTLILRSNHTFHQTRVSSGIPAQADGTWRMIGEAGLVFSSSFLAMPHQAISADGSAYGELYKTLGVWPPYISLSSSTKSPLFRRKLL